MSIFEVFTQDYFYFTILLVFIFLLAGLPIGYLLIHRNLGLFSDSISHSLIPGLVTSVLMFGLNTQYLILGALVWGALVAFVFTALSGVNDKTRDTTLVVISLFGISFGLVMNQWFNLRIDFTHLLFGSPLLADSSDVSLLATVGLITLVVITLLWKTILRICIDPIGSTFWLGRFKSQFLFSALTTLLIIIGFQIFGVMLTTGLLILPNIAFDGFNLRLLSQLLLNIVLTTLLAILCYFVSFHLNLTFSSTFILGISILALINRSIQIARQQ